ncbi:MAG: GspE/PulE family protein, partial [Rhodocyclaceae bacterium]
MARPEKIRLGDLLIQQGLLTAEELDRALKEQQISGRKLGRVIVDSGRVSEEAIARALARQLGAEYIDLHEFQPRPELVRLLPEAQARRFRAIVLDEKNGLLRIGMSDPTDLNAFDEIARILRRDIDLVVVAEGQLLPLLDRVYRRTEEIAGLAKDLTQELGDIPVEFGGLFGIAPGAEDAPVVRLLQTIFEEARKQKASDIHVEPQEKSLVIRFR